MNAEKKMLAVIKAGLKAINSETIGVECQREFLGAAYTELVGYNPFEDDPSQTVDEVAELLVGVAFEGINAEYACRWEDDKTARAEVERMWKARDLARRGSSVQLAMPDEQWEFALALLRA